MALGWKNIVAFFDATEQGKNTLQSAATLAKRNNAYLTGICATCSGEFAEHERYTRGAKAIQDVIRYRQELRECEENELKITFDTITTELAERTKFISVKTNAPTYQTALNNLLCDLLITPHPLPTSMPAEWSGEKLLLKTRLPILILPQTWHAQTIGSRILLAWNGSREALRAITDSMPLLFKAQAVRLLSIDPKKNHSAMAEHLQRHDIAVEYLEVKSSGTPIEQVILEQASEFQADLLVIGAYSRSRFREIILGGVTIKLLSETPVPLFVSR